ncbi:MULTISPECIES: hypothetical protein [Clostridium]|uniref:hypothetical protein n=1 Tax=Clostridium TaxID=1485 RepID=UPI003515C5A1
MYKALHVQGIIRGCTACHPVDKRERRLYPIITKDSDFSSKLENILNGQFNLIAPNVVWCTDITYLWTDAGFVYLTSIMDSNSFTSTLYNFYYIYLSSFLPQ